MTELRTNVLGGLLGLYTQTSLHPGAGTALGTVDLPVQRERHTHWPTVAASALKGILRDACREKIAARDDLDNLDRHDDDKEKDTPETRARRRKGSSCRERADSTLELDVVFGPPKAGSSEFAGALSVTDARLLAFPVRSLKGVFAWTSCPAVLERLQRDAALAGHAIDWKVPNVEANRVVAPPGCPCLIGQHVVLEEFEFQKTDGDPAAIGKWITEQLLPDAPAFQATRARFLRQFLLLADDDFTHFARYATEVNARIGLNYEGKTVKGGALFYQEFLPPETVLYSVVLANASRARNGGGQDAAGVLQFLRGHLPGMLQVGGDETTGKGYCATRLRAGK